MTPNNTNNNNSFHSWANAAVRSRIVYLIELTTERYGKISLTFFKEEAEIENEIYIRSNSKTEYLECILILLENIRENGTKDEDELIEEILEEMEGAGLFK